VKQQVTIRLDADLIAWFKRHTPDGRGYQTSINRALRAYVEQQERRRDEHATSAASQLRHAPPSTPSRPGA